MGLARKEKNTLSVGLRTGVFSTWAVSALPGLFRSPQWKVSEKGSVLSAGTNPRDQPCDWEMAKMPVGTPPTQKGEVASEGNHPSLCYWLFVVSIWDKLLCRSLLGPLSSRGWNKEPAENCSNHCCLVCLFFLWAARPLQGRVKEPKMLEGGFICIATTGETTTLGSPHPLNVWWVWGISVPCFPFPLFPIRVLGSVSPPSPPGQGPALCCDGEDSACSAPHFPCLLNRTMAL